MGSQLIEAKDPDAPRVLIAGGGIAALESVLALRAMAPGAFEVLVLAPEREARPQPLAVAEPFGVARRPRVDLREFALENGARYMQGTLSAVDARRRTVTVDGGRTLAYDALLVAIGATARPALPGAFTFRGPRDIAGFKRLLDEVDDGPIRSLAFVLPRAVCWSLPLYELALMTAARRDQRGRDLRIELVTHERDPLAIFGRSTARRVRALLRDAHIALRTSTIPIVAQPGRLFVAPHGAVAADRTVALGKLSVVRIPGLPQRRGGFIATDEYGRVDGGARIYAAGDATAFPVKQGGIATQQADAAVSAIAADLGAPVIPQRFAPTMRGVLLTGAAAEYLTSDGERDSADEEPLWLPPGKIAGRYLAPYLAGEDVTGLATLRDVEAVETLSGGHAEALALALDAADAAAGWGDNAEALRWLDVAEKLNSALPVAYAPKRREWSAQARG